MSSGSGPILFEQVRTGQALSVYTVVRPLIDGHPDQSGGQRQTCAEARASSLSGSGVRGRGVVHLLQPAAAERDGAHVPLAAGTHWFCCGCDAGGVCLRIALFCADGRPARAARADDAAVCRGLGSAAAGGDLAHAAVRDLCQHSGGTVRFGHAYRAADRAGPGG